jgi:oxygen-independent coproporphyrinogen-3 oxidase
LLRRYPANCTSYPGEELYVAMYQALIAHCGAAGLSQYEISNFAQPGYQSRHNLTYWSNDEYFGFGVSAHRYINGVRSSNYRSLRRYMRDFLANETFERIDDKTRAKEAIFLGLRLREGINLAEFRVKYGLDIEQVLAAKLSLLADGGFLTYEDGRLKLSQEGVLVSNLVIAELV